MNFDNNQAYKEGWCLFSDGQLQRLDDGPIIDGEQNQGPTFTGDREALIFVTNKASEGSDYHKLALSLTSKGWIDSLI